MLQALLLTVTQLFTFLILARVLLSWFPINPRGPMGQVVVWVIAATEPVLAPLRRAMPSFGGLDLSPMVVLLVISFVIQPIIRGF
jgi:YggT family protein